jgi:hypothetical protein
MKAFFFISMFVIAWTLKDNPRYGVIWRAYKIFFTVLLATLMLDFAKKSLKEWWSK